MFLPSGLSAPSPPHKPTLTHLNQFRSSSATNYTPHNHAHTRKIWQDDTSAWAAAVFSGSSTSLPNFSTSPPAAVFSPWTSLPGFSTVSRPSEWASSIFLCSSALLAYRMLTFLAYSHTSYYWTRPLTVNNCTRSSCPRSNLAEQWRVSDRTLLPLSSCPQAQHPCQLLMWVNPERSSTPPPHHHVTHRVVRWRDTNKVSLFAD